MDWEKYRYYRQQLNKSTNKTEAKAWFKKAEDLLVEELRELRTERPTAPSVGVPAVYSKGFVEIDLNIEIEEDKKICDKYDSRLDLDENSWLQLPRGKSVIDYYKEKKVNNAIQLFVDKEVSLAKAAELSGLSLNDFIHLLGSKNIPWVDYTKEDYELDNKALELLTQVNKDIDQLQEEIKESLDNTRFLHSDECYLEMKTNKKVLLKMIQDGRSNEEIKRIFEGFLEGMTKLLREQNEKNDDDVK